MGNTLETPGTGRPSFMSSSALDPNTDSTSPGPTVTRNDLRASAEKIQYTFLLRGAEREIVLPEAILQSIANAIEVEARDDPAIFDEAKDYLFQAMERDTFPGFLTAKALGNLVPPSATIRLIVGLLAMKSFCPELLILHNTLDITRTLRTSVYNMINNIIQNVNTHKCLEVDSQT
jgi:hypothetical protein